MAVAPLRRSRGAWALRRRAGCGSHRPIRDTKPPGLQSWASGFAERRRVRPGPAHAERPSTPSAPAHAERWSVRCWAALRLAPTYQSVRRSRFRRLGGAAGDAQRRRLRGLPSAATWDVGPRCAWRQPTKAFGARGFVGWAEPQAMPNGHRDLRSCRSSSARRPPCSASPPRLLRRRPASLGQFPRLSFTGFQLVHGREQAGGRWSGFAVGTRFPPAP